MVLLPNNGYQLSTEIINLPSIGRIRLLHVYHGRAHQCTLYHKVSHVINHGFEGETDSESLVPAIAIPTYTKDAY